MQDRYAGDVGDFGKIAMLRALSRDLKLGVVWYRNAATETNSDGRHTEFSTHRCCDPELHDRLTSISRSGKRCVEALEKAGIFKPNTAFCNMELPLYARAVTRSQRENATRARERWAVAASETVAGRDLVFLDPDNGIAPQRVKKWSKSSAKYVFLDELAAFVERDQTVVLYQHQQRRKLPDQISTQLAQLRSINRSVWAVSFHIKSPRIYYILPANERMNKELWDRTLLFIAGPWGRKERFRIQRPVWVFGYGSLIWGTGVVRCAAEHSGVLEGWSRNWTWISQRRHGAPTASLVSGGRVRGKFLNLHAESLVADLEEFRRRENRSTERQAADVPEPGSVTYFWTMGSNLSRFDDLAGKTGDELTEALAQRARSIVDKGPDGVTAVDYIRRVHEFDPDDHVTGNLVRATVAGGREITTD